MTEDRPHPTSAGVSHTTAEADASVPADEEPDPRLSLELRLETRDTQPPLDGWLQPMLVRIAAEAGVAGGELGIVLVDDARMSELHARYMGDPETTDVLTFDLRDEPDAALEGDIVICRDEAERQGLRRGHEARVEALLYAVHGLMHLLGEDDEDEEDFDRMHAREDRLLSAVGLGNVFSGNDRRGNREEE